jgi:protein SDA1
LALLVAQLAEIAEDTLTNDLNVPYEDVGLEEGNGTAGEYDMKFASLEAAKKTASSSDGVHIGERHTRSAQEGKGRLRGADSVDSAMTREPGNFGSTNREKPRNKSIMIIMGSKGVRGKKKQSLKEKQKRLHAHIDRAKSPRRRLIMEHRASRRAESRPVS